jgi:hypothetical protein
LSDQVEVIRALRADRKPIAAIARATGLSRPIYNILSVEVLAG